MKDEHCVAIVAALYQHAAVISQPNVPSDEVAAAWALGLLQEAKKAVVADRATPTGGTDD